jgi:PAS domain S-box-containing protein
MNHGEHTKAICADPAEAVGQPGLTQIIDASPIPTFVLDHRHVITHWNRALAAISGIPQQEAIGSSDPWRAFYPEARPVLANLIIDGADRAGLVKLYGETIRPSTLIDGAFEVEDFLPPLTGGGRWLFFTAAPLRDSNGRIVGAIETLQDITERKEAEAALLRSHHQLEERVRQRTSELSDANEELSHYAYAVSHDLRSPLRATRNYADFLEEDLAGTLNDEQRSYFAGMRQALRHGEDLVSDLLALSAIGHTPMSPQMTPLDDFLTELVDGMALDKDQCVRLPPDWPAILVERTLLGQILRNLIGNGLKFNRSPQKMVEINWQEAPTAGMKITVRDNGIGIEPRFFEQIFGIFQRLHTRSEFEGTGIGLAIVRKAAQQLHGSVHIESAPGAGSCFTLVLPRHISTLQEASHEPA